mmetsp:Transcript_37732/g.78316  ORF Transcript_37732/g.78316 Transcript_37732/m.78316 type:complete len:243 (-) Transcript_37732:1504-2232(-)
MASVDSAFSTNSFRSSFSSSSERPLKLSNCGVSTTIDFCFGPLLIASASARGESKPIKADVAFAAETCVESTPHKFATNVSNRLACSTLVMSAGVSLLAMKGGKLVTYKNRTHVSTKSCGGFLTCCTSSFGKIGFGSRFWFGCTARNLSRAVFVGCSIMEWTKSSEVPAPSEGSKSLTSSSAGSSSAFSGNSESGRFKISKISCCPLKNHSSGSISSSSILACVDSLISRSLPRGILNLSSV